MRTAVEIPEGWRELDADGGVVLAPPGEGTDLIVEVEPPSTAPVDEAELLPALLGRIPPGREARVIASATGATACGWPYDQIEVLVVDGDGRPLEARLVIVYRFLHAVAVLTVRARQPERLHALRADLDAVIASARPDWRDGQVAALAELWPGAVRSS